MFLIFGKGISGKAASKLLSSLKIPHFLVDDKTENWESLLNKVKTVVVSPGIAPSHKVFKLAKEKGLEIIGETELAYRFWRGKIVAVTGTDGKTTTTTLVYEILKKTFSDVYIGGNIGIPFSEIVSKTKTGLAVLEVSSFQGYTLKSFKPKVGIFLNFSEDHLNWHRDLDDYFLGKERIFKNQTESDFLILNPSVERFKEVKTKAKKVYWKRDIEVKNGKVYIFGKPIFETSKLKIPGKHNLINASFAAAAALLMGAEREAVEDTLYNFKGLPFRLQYLGNFCGVEVYNDSKSTTPNALRAALESFDKPVVLIFGGADKGADFSTLKGLFKKKVKFAFAYGENRKKLFETFRDTLQMEVVKTLEDAIKKVSNILRRGDILLFSPAAASFDQFSSYAERGKRFNELVEKYLRCE